MNTTIAANNNTAWTWKLTTILLTVVLAILGATAGLEFYYLCRDHSHTSEVQSVAVSGKGSTSPLPGDDQIKDAVLAPLAPNDVGNPWDQINALHQRMDQMFNDTLRQFPTDDTAVLSAMSKPNLDVREEKDHYTVRADMPGADKSSIKVNVEGRLLTISAERTSVNETKNDDKVVRSERSMAQFVRAIELPGPVKTESVDAKYNDGVLTLTLPKSDQVASSSQIPVK
jgi:HSP20 family protein